MNEQEIFDTVVKHLFAQNARALGGNGCAYRALAKDNVTVLKCAVGCLIPDADYDPDYEGIGIGGGMIEVMQSSGMRRILYAKLQATLRSEGIDVDDPNVLDLLIALQEIHDENMPGEWFIRLKNLAESYSFNTRTLYEASGEEPPGYGVDCFEDAMCLKYPLKDRDF